jgi:hypothetical protein
VARGGLARRTLIRGALLAVIGAAAFAVVLFSVASLYNESERRAQRSQEVLVVGNHLERLVVDLETGLRGDRATRLGSGSCRSSEDPCQPVSRMGACCDDMRRKFHHRGAV